MKRFLTPSILLGILLFSPPSYSTESNFQNAIKAFKQGQFQQALTLFLDHQHDGKTSPNLTFNIGVCYYKLKNYDLAQITFKKLLDDRKWQDLARYNLALVAEKQNQRKKAEQWYRQVAATAANSKLRTLAEQKLVAGNNHRKRSSNNRYLITTLTFGYDENPYSFNDALSAATGSDTHLDALIYGLHEINSLYTLSGFGFLRRYDTFDSLDISTLNATLNRKITEQFWGLDNVSLGATWINVGNNSYTHELAPGLSFHKNQGKSKYSFDYELAFIQGGSDYDYLDGIRNSFIAVWRYHDLPLNTRVKYRLDIDERDDLKTGTTALIQSQIKNSLKIEATWRHNTHFEFIVTGNFSYSAYQDETRIVDLDGQDKSATRNTQRYQLETGVKYHLSKSFNVNATVGKEKVNDDFETYSHDRTTANIGLWYLY